MALFGKKSPRKSVVLLDIENGSVGSGLVRLNSGEAPHLFGAQRAATPLMDTRSAATLLRSVEHASAESLLHISEVAARLRHANALGPVGKVVLFLAAPWGVPNLSEGRPDFSRTLLESVAPRIRSLFGDVPVVTHAHASAAVAGLRALYPHERDALVLSINGEVSELMLLEDGRVVGHATAPVGVHTIVRTLKSHAGMNDAEARSALKLGVRNEAIEAAEAHFAGEFAYTAQELYGGQGRGSVFVLAHEPAGEWFARALSHNSVAGLFPQGGAVRLIRAGHFGGLVGGSSPDTHLALAALYTSAAHGA